MTQRDICKQHWGGAHVNHLCEQQVQCCALQTDTCSPALAVAPQLSAPTPSSTYISIGRFKMARTHWLWSDMWSASSVESSFTGTFSMWVNLAPQDWNSLRSRQPAKRWYKSIHRTAHSLGSGWQSSLSRQAGWFCCVQRRTSSHEELWRGSALCMEMQTLPFPAAPFCTLGSLQPCRGEKKTTISGGSLRYLLCIFNKILSNKYKLI